MGRRVLTESLMIVTDMMHMVNTRCTSGATGTALAVEGTPPATSDNLRAAATPGEPPTQR